MYYWAFLFLVIALICGAFGFPGMVPGAYMLVWLFWIFMGLFFINLIIAVIRKLREPGQRR